LRVIGILGGLSVAFAFGLLLLLSDLNTVVVTGEAVSFLEIGAQIVADYWVALLVLGLLLSASLIGALTLARLDKEV
jgi:NADH:ubiquinone oxidoreductase subunit 6 (subunit J)